MNNWDKDNLQFLLNINSKELKTWFEQADDDDIAYANELLRAARLEISMQAAAILDEIAEEDCSIAADYLKKYRLN